MLNIGFSELALIVVSALLFIGPKDFPVVIRHIGRALRELRRMSESVRAQIDGVMEDSGLGERKKPRTIIDLEGREQVAYDLSDLEQKP